MAEEQNISPQIPCPACGKSGEGAFCAHCGEDMKTERIDFRYVVSQFFEMFVGFESNRLLHTFRDMAIRPGKTIRRYLGGERKPYYNPVDYALLAGGLVIVWSFFINDGVFEELKKQNENDPSLTGVAKVVLKDPSTFMNTVFLLQFPIAGLFTWLRSLKGVHTYGEHLYANAFVIGQLFAFQLLFNSFYYLFEPGPVMLVLAQVYMVAAFFYYVIAYSQWRHGRIRFPRIILTTLFLTIVYVCSFMLALGLAAGWIYLYDQWTGT